MTIKQLTYFIELARNESFTKAANNLFITQSALSKTLANLESELGHQLVERSSKRFNLTSEGKMLFERGEKALNSINKELQQLNDCLNLEQGKLTVGVPPVISTIYFTKIIHNFTQKYPNIQLKVLEEGANNVKEKVEKDELDIGVVILPFDSDKLNVKPAFASDNVLIVHKTHLLAAETEVSLKELSNENFISLNKTFMLRDMMIDMCQQSGFTPNIVYESSQWDFVAEMVSLNQGVAILPRPILSRFVPENIKILTLKDPPFPWEVALIVNKDKYLSNVIKLFIDFVINTPN